MKKLKVATILLSVCLLSSCGCSTNENGGIPEHAHYWNDPVWSWNEDNTEAKATFECSVYNHYHVEVAKKSDNQIKIETVIEADHYQDGEDSYVAEVLFNGAYYRSPAHIVKTYKSEHVFNEFGVCEKDEEYRYPENEIEYDFDPYYYESRFQGTVEIGDKLKKAGDVVYYKWHVQTKNHSISITELKGLEEDEFKLAALFGDTFQELEAYDYNHIEANNVYLRIEAKNDKDHPSFVIREDHHLNDVNFCPYCETYYGTRMIPGGVAWVGLKEGEKLYFRCQTWPGRTHRLTSGEKLAGHADWFSFFYQDKYHEPHPYNLSDPFPDIWAGEEEAGFYYIYGYVSSQVTGTGTFIIDYND